MIKKLIKYFLFKAYAIGKVEYGIRIKKILRAGYDKIGNIHPEASITADAVIINPQNDPNKISIGKQCFISCELMLFKHGGEISIGEHTFIGKDTRIWSAKSIKIGNRVLISHNVNIHDNVSHPLNAAARHQDFLHIFSKGGFQENVDLREKEIIIEDDVWIGFNATILKGVTIGKGAIVGANTIITKDVPPYAVVIDPGQSQIIKYTD